MHLSSASPAFALGAVVGRMSPRLPPPHPSLPPLPPRRPPCRMIDSELIPVLKQCSLAGHAEYKTRHSLLMDTK